MSVLYASNSGWLLSHNEFINSIYKDVQVENAFKCYKIADDLFYINNPYKKQQKNRKRRAAEKDNENKNSSIVQDSVDHVRKCYTNFQQEICNLLPLSISLKDGVNNKVALEVSRKVYEETGKATVSNATGENQNHARLISINSHKFLFPPNSKFYSKDVADIEHYLIDIKYDLIILDPPWWNKYVRRKKAKTDHGYKMMYNHDLQKIPINKLLTDTGLVVVWCTNSLQHLETLQGVIFDEWKVHCVAKLYWLKITRSGEPICDFSTPPNKQPFEQILVGSRNPEHEFKCENNKLIISIPSALHSHKPPLLEVLKPYFSTSPNCLELFARYLLPNCSSWGLEALRFQHESLYQLVD